MGKDIAIPLRNLDEAFIDYIGDFYMKLFRLQWILLMVMGLMGLQISAQSTPIITISVPTFWEMLFNENVLAEFEAQHGVDVQLIYDAQTPFGPSRLDDPSIDNWQKALTEYAQSADVLFVDNDFLSPELTRAGVFLDLTPLVQVDSFLNPADFHPKVWESFGWDDSQWALPIAGSAIHIEYIQSKFDEKNLIYPDSNWSMLEIENTARELAEYDEAGNVTLPGMLIGLPDRNLLFYSMVQQGFSDNQQPSMPQFPAEALAPLLDTWKKLVDEGVIATDPSKYINRFDEIPLRIGSGGVVAISVTVDDDDGNNESEDVTRTGFGSDEPQFQTTLAPLPNLSGGVSAQGFGISSGTPNPQLAYELVRYLSERPEIAELAFNAEPARLSYATPEMEDDDDGTVITIMGGASRNEADMALIQETLQSGISAADMRFAHYLSFVDDKMQGGLDALSALQATEAEANQVVAKMMDADLTIIVNVPEQVVVPEGQIILDFGFQTFIRPLPNADLWDDLISDFVANDPEVGHVNLNIGGRQPSQLLAENDCVYQPTTIGLFDLDTKSLLSIDPLLSADPNYNINDLPPNVLSQMQFNGMTYGLPMTLQPEFLTYKPEAFTDANIPLPIDGWNFGEFENALIQLQAILNDDVQPLESISPINTHLLMLIAAQGGQLFDTSTDPVTIDFTSPESVNAVMSVLNLAKDNLIKYERLGESVGFEFVGIDGDDFSNIRAGNFIGFVEEGTRLVAYPSGNRFVPLSLTVGAGFISKDSDYPEACYRWLSYLTNHPFAFTDMPALLSTLDDPSAEASVGGELLGLYHQVADQARQPNAINPITIDPFINLWLNRAFDAYVLDDGDLEAELANAEQLTQSYIDCISQPFEGDVTQDNMFDRIETCGTQVNIQ